MAFSTDITLSGSFVNLNSVSGLATNLNFIIQNKTSKDIVLIASSSQPTDEENTFIHTICTQKDLKPCATAKTIWKKRQ